MQSKLASNKAERCCSIGVCFEYTLSACCCFQYYPDHTKGLILMGDLNVNYLRNLDAAEQVGHKHIHFCHE